MRDNDFRDLLDRVADEAPALPGAAHQAIREGGRRRTRRRVGTVLVGAVAAASAIALVAADPLAAQDRVRVGSESDPSVVHLTCTADVPTVDTDVVRAQHDGVHIEVAGGPETRWGYRLYGEHPHVVNTAGDEVMDATPEGGIQPHGEVSDGLIRIGCGPELGDGPTVEVRVVDPAGYHRHWIRDAG